MTRGKIGKGFGPESGKMYETEVTLSRNGVRRFSIQS